MSLPTKNEIVAAIENLQLQSLPQLTGYSPSPGILGPESYAGGFCIVFPFVKGNAKKAVRVWHQEIDNGQERYRLMSSDFSSANLSCLCKTEFVPDALSVKGQMLDIVIMEWVDGLPLKPYIQSVIDNNSVAIAEQQIKTLATQLLAVFRTFHRYQFSHGDLQHDNIIITPNGDIKLIDYDCFYTPSMAGKFRQTTIGYKGYQHPTRTSNNQLNEKMDYFSELIIYLSLIAIAENPALWSIAKDSDFNFLFSETDFSDLRSSSLFQGLSSSSHEVQILLLILEEYLNSKDLTNLEPFDVLLDRYTKDPEIKDFSIDSGGVAYKNAKITLRWHVENASSLVLNGTSLVSAKGTRTVSVTNNETFRLEVTNGLKSRNATCAVKVVEPPQISLKLSSNKLRKGKHESAHLKWEVRNAGTSVTLSANDEELSQKKSGEMTVSPEETTTYTLSTIGLDGNKVFKKSVRLFVAAESNISFAADKNYSYPGIPVVLSWEVKNAKSVELVGYGKQPDKGQMIVEPDKDSTYELKVTDTFGSNTQNVEVRMLPLPMIQSLLVPTPQFNNKTHFQLNFPTVQASVSVPQIPYASLKVPTVSLGNVHQLQVRSAATPNFHKLSVNKGNWWNRLVNKFRNK